ncbi:MAG TPA: hypothetical protein DEA08_25185, partial [Planctomycetes bacterium]|nr:hypothetical protein [Planctomycetota bacterium]
MDLAHAQAAFLFQQGRVPEQALRWALGQPRESGDDLCEVLLAAGWISEEVAADARGQPLRRETQRLAELEDNEETAPLPGEVRRLMAERERAAREAALQRVQGEDGQPGARSDLLLSESAPPEEDEAQGEDAEEELPPLGPYRLLRRLGQGGMGTVFLAEHTLLRRQVALKRIRPRAEVDAERALKRFEVEARAMARLEHEHILRILDIRVEQGAAYMIMELAEGGSLADRLEKTPQLPPDEAMALGEKLARALHHAHVHAIVHRDVKPDNVLFDGEGRPLLTDFGLAKPLDESLSISRPGSLIGTLLYMAPEQVKGEPVDARVDVYALGVTLLEILAGEPPFLRETQGEVLEAILNQPAPLGLLPEGTPRPVRTIVARCLAKRREDRYASAEALAEDCRRYLAREPILAQPVGVAERLLLWRRRHPALFALLIAFAFLTTLLPGLVELVRQRQQVAEAREEAQRQERVARALEDSLAQVQAAQRRAEQAERETRAARDALQVELGEAERLRSDLLGRTGQRQRAHRGFARARRGGRDSFALALGQLDLWRQAPAALLPLPGEGVDALA